MDITPETSPLYPILGNALFPPGIDDAAFRHLRNIGCIQVSNYIKEGTRLTIPELMEQEGTFRLKFWNALQITHFLSTLPALRQYIRSFNVFEKFCSEAGLMAHTLAANYRLLILPAETDVLKCVSE